VGIDGVLGAEPHAFPAVDAELADDPGLAVLDADRLGGTGCQAVDASDAFLGVDVQGVPILFVHAFLPFVLIVSSSRVPRPTLDVIRNVSVFFLMLARPMPAPKPSSRISGVAVE
jgi:hypothetical protein